MVRQKVISQQSSCTFEQYYELPDGQVITLANERFRVNECWFAPNILGKSDCLPLQSAVAVALSRAPAAMRASLLSNVVLAGGPALTPGLQERFKAEIKKVLPETLSSSVHIRCSPTAKYDAWIGASILSSCASDNGMITREEYNEYGPSECASYANSYLFCQPYCSNITDASVLEVARRCSNLQRLKLSYCRNITDASVLEVASRCSNLQTLDLRNCSNITSACKNALRQSHPKLQLGW